MSKNIYPHACAGHHDRARWGRRGMLDALNKADGAFPGHSCHPRERSLVAEGNFKLTREAAELSKASLFQGPTVPATFRFASGSGIPTIADADLVRIRMLLL